MTQARRDGLLRAAAIALPTPEQAAILVAALAPTTRSAAAWDRWASGHVDPLTALAERGARTLLPLLDVALHALPVTLTLPVRDALRAATLSEKIRSQAYDDIVVSLTAALGGMRVLFLKGAALAHAAYPDRFLRHCHDVDLLAHPDDVDHITAALAAAGFARNPLGVLTHRSGLPLRVHRSCFAIGAYDLPFETVWARQTTVTVGGAKVPTPAASHAFLQICGHASYWHGPESLRWVTDAYFLAAPAGTKGATMLDWDEVTSLAQDCGLVVPLSLQLGWLRETLAVAVPDTTLAQLKTAADAATIDRLRAAALGAVGAQPRRLLHALRAAGVHSAPTLLRDALAPPPTLRRLRIGARARGARVQRRNEVSCTPA